MACFNRGDPTHMLKYCQKHLDLVKAAKRRLEYMEKRTGNKRKHDDDDRSSLNEEEDNITGEDRFSTIMSQTGEELIQG